MNEFAAAMRVLAIGNRITTARDSLAFTLGARTALERLREDLSGTGGPLVDLAIVNAIDDADDAEDAITRMMRESN